MIVLATSPPSTDREAGLGQKQGPFRIEIKEHVHEPLMAIPMASGDQSFWHHGEATERTISEEEKGHGSGPAKEAHDAIGEGACPGMAADDQKIQWIMRSWQAKTNLLARTGRRHLA